MKVSQLKGPILLDNKPFPVGATKWKGVWPSFYTIECKHIKLCGH